MEGAPGATGRAKDPEEGLVDDFEYHARRCRGGTGFGVEF